VYAAADVRSALRCLSPPPARGFVAGRIRLHGPIVEGPLPDEFRGSAAEIETLYVAGQLANLRSMFEATYGVPVEAARDLRRLTPLRNGFGDLVPPDGFVFAR
jgi:hypothetical protein